MPPYKYSVYVIEIIVSENLNTPKRNVNKWEKKVLDRPIYIS